MKKINSNKLKFLGIVAAVLLLQTAANAGYFLPKSSLWEGSRKYTENGVNAVVEYAVYDTQADGYHNVLDGIINGFLNPGSGRFIYAYQIQNQNDDAQADPITSFELLGCNPALASGIGWQDDQHDGLTPINDHASFVWKWEGGVFIVDEHSAFLVFSSNNGPVEKSIKITTSADTGPGTPGPGGNQAPEPATLILLATGVMGILRKRKIA
jgi:hypothetical protein